LYDGSGGNSSGEGRNLEGENFFAVLLSERVSGGLVVMFWFMWFGGCIALHP
jgi:hypothetical protein